MDPPAGQAALVEQNDLRPAVPGAVDLLLGDLVLSAANANGIARPNALLSLANGGQR